MKTNLRKLSTRQLTKLAIQTGVLLPYMTDKEKVDAIANWAAGYSLNWQDFTSRFPWLGEPFA